MIDSHCHLTAPEFDTDRDAVIERARAVGVSHIVTIADALADVPRCQAIAESCEGISFTAGVHPHHASGFDAGRDIATLRAALQHPQCVAVGEIGLDYHYMNSPKDTQQRVFESQLLLAKELEAPAVVHCRESVEDIWTIVHHVKPPRIVIHCCTEKWDDVRRFIDAGHSLSCTGIATYPKSESIRHTIKECPIDQLMIETDAPFLAPVPHRGKRCEPAFVADVLRLVAELKNISIEEADRITTKNTVEFFGLSLP
jgi:TatD DNase family protein